MKLSGAREMTATMRRVEHCLTLDAMRENLRLGAEAIRARAAEMCPRGALPPHMADHIVIQFSDKGLVVFVGPARRFFYALFVEFGTIKMGPHPFIRPAFDTEQTRALIVIARATQVTISNVFGGGGLL